MSGKYMKVKRIFIPTITLIIMASQLFACSAASQDESLQMLNNSPGIEIEIADQDTNSVGNADSQTQTNQLDWTELGSLTTNQSLREAFESIFKTTGEAGNKEGIIYETPSSNTDTVYTYENNNTLDVAIHNYNFRSLFDTQQSEIADAARNNFIDLEDEDDTTAIASAINSYFNLLPDTDDGNSNPNETLTRAQAMAAITRATTPVGDSLQSDDAFTTAVGTSEYNIFAQSLNDSAFLNTTDGSLDTLSYTGKMTRGEAIYLLMNKFFPDAMKEDNASKYPGLTFEDCVNGGEYTGTNAEILKQMLDDSSTHKVDSRIYNAMIVAHNYSVITAETNWDAAITKAEFIDLLTKTLYAETTTMQRFNIPDGVSDMTEDEFINSLFNGTYKAPEGTVNGYTNPELVPKPSDYGVSIKTPDDIPAISCKDWDYEKHPILYGYTQDPGHFKIVKDGLTGDVYYPGMVTPDGDTLLVDDKSTMALGELRDKYGYDFACQITLEQAREYFGEPDDSSFSTEYWED